MNPTGWVSRQVLQHVPPDLRKVALDAVKRSPEVGASMTKTWMADGSGGFDDTHDGFDPRGRVECFFFTDPWIPRDSYGKW